MKRIYKVIKPYFAAHRLVMVKFILLITISGTCTFLLPIISSKLIDYLSNNLNLKLLWNYCTYFAFVSISSIIVGYVANRMYVKLNAVLVYEMNKDIITYVQKIRLSYFENKNIAQIVQQITVDVHTLIDFYFDFLQNIILNIFKVFIPLFIIFYIDFHLVLIIIGLMFLYILGYLLFKKMLFRVNYENKEVQNQYFNKIYEQLKLIRFLKIHGINNKFEERVKPIYNKMYCSLLKLQKINYLYAGLENFILMLSQIILFLLGGYLVINQQISLGIFILVSSYFSLGIGGIRYFFSLGKKIQEALVSYERILKIMSETSEESDGITLEHISEIEIENLSFAYNDNLIIKNLNIKLVKGKIYAFLGENGSGKSTFIYLLMGFYYNYQGYIKYNGVSIEDLNIVELRKKHISIVEQEPEFIEDTIYNNLSINNKNISSDKIKMLMEKWGLQKFIDINNLGKNMILNEENTNLSGGEKQKLALIRSEIKNSDVLILDEPTSALDRASKNELVKYIKAQKDNKIILIITHDNLLAKECDVQITLN